jgi:predicted Zn-dependent peptidase
VYLLLADSLQQRQDVAGSIEQLRKYLKVAPTADNADHVRSRIQELERSSKALAAKQPEHQ